MTSVDLAVAGAEIEGALVAALTQASPALPLPLVLDPILAEEGVLLGIRGHPREKAFRRSRDPLYRLPEERRSSAFARFHLEWFQELGFAQPIELAVGELPILARECHRCVVGRALASRDEGADLLVAPGLPGRAGRTIAVRLRPAAFADPAALLGLLRSELLHVADMVDPEFGYDTRLPATDGGPAYEQLLRDRYRVLWQTTVVGRLVRRGALPSSAACDSFARFAAAFPMLGASADVAFARIFHEWPLTHAELVAFAADPRARGDRFSLGPGGRCPLCRFPTYAPEPDQLAPAVLSAIAKDFPGWQHTDGLCRQCADLYRARAASQEISGPPDPSRG
jgi:hypothetical protein